MVSSARHLNTFAQMQARTAPTFTWAQQWDELKAEWAAGTPTEEIAEKLNRSVSAVLTQAARLGLPRRQSQGRKAKSGETATPAARPARNNVISFRTHEPIAIEAEPTRVHVEKSRNCLMCSTSFHSHGSHNRICPRCKAGAAYQNGHEDHFRMLSA